MIKNIFLLALGLFSFPLFAQLEFSGELNLQGMYSTGEDLPFWMYKNQRGRISENTNAAGWISGRVNYDLGANSSLEIGVGILYQDGISDRVFLDESYVQFRNTWLEVIAGRKQKPELYNGLSATNENIVWSLNARPLPGVQFRTREPIMLFPDAGLGFEASLSEYLLEKDRHVSYARVHHKSLHLVYQPNEDWYFRGGIQHFAQWGGNSKSEGPQPEGIKDYLLMFFGRQGGENAVIGDQINVLGNQLGSYELNIKRSFKDMELEFIYNHMFEDGTGTRFANFPDGRYGIMLNFKDERKLVNNVLYEFYYTKNQSTKSSAPHKNDNYFNNFQTYRSGWTYEKRILGTPFFQYDPEKDMVINNKFTMHHIGISGSISNYFESYPYKLMLSAGRNDGRHGVYFTPNEDVAYISYEMLILQNFVDLSFQLGAEYHSLYSPVYGAGLHLSKRF
ncbi:MAG: capsule assembly Wzi family protein [Bacteroidota bacterium]